MNTTLNQFVLELLFKNVIELSKGYLSTGLQVTFCLKGQPEPFTNQVTFKVCTFTIFILLSFMS